MIVNNLKALSNSVPAWRKVVKDNLLNRTLSDTITDWSTRPDVTFYTNKKLSYLAVKDQFGNITSYDKLGKKVKEVFQETKFKLTQRGGKNLKNTKDGYELPKHYFDKQTNVHFATPRKLANGKEYDSIKIRQEPKVGSNGMIIDKSYRATDAFGSPEVLKTQQSVPLSAPLDINKFDLGREFNGVAFKLAPKEAEKICPRHLSQNKKQSLGALQIAYYKAKFAIQNAINLRKSVNPNQELQDLMVAMNKNKK